MDQAHRGYTMADDAGGFRSVNPLFMKYTPTDGRFSGQQGYGYRSLEAFVDAALRVNAGEVSAGEVDGVLATAATTLRTTAVLEAGRLSIDRAAPVEILYLDPAAPCTPSILK